MSSISKFLLNKKRRDTNRGTKPRMTNRTKKINDNEKLDEMKCDEHERQKQNMELWTTNNKHCEPHQMKLTHQQPDYPPINMCTNNIFAKCFLIQ